MASIPSPRLPLQDKAALISGASRGIGEAIAHAFVANGARVMLASRDADQLRRVAAEIDPSGERAKIVVMDVTDAASIEAAVAATVTAFGRLDAAVNNAGLQIPRSPLADVVDDDFDRVLAVNLRGVFLALKHEIRAMLKTGGGAIVNISSAAGIVGIPNITPYATSKHGLTGLTKVAALDYAARGIRVNAVAPGTTNTELFKVGPGSSPEALTAIMARVPMGRVAEPDEISGAVVWLCSEASAYVTGQTLAVDGGFVVI
jgi:NAD(P)-dependent dehydrogenase (short-subunit alcohol dehydrogenase family)